MFIFMRGKIMKKHLNLFVIFCLTAIMFFGCSPDGSINDDDDTTPLTSGAYIITGSGTSFTATRSGVTIGAANQPIQTVIDSIKAHANSTSCTIQFGNGTDVLDIGSNSVRFDAWSTITLLGKITSTSHLGMPFGTICLTNGSSIYSKADISNPYNG